MRWLLAMIKHETNTFSPVPTPLARFFRGNPEILAGERAIRAYENTDSGLGGYIEVARPVETEDHLRLLWQLSADAAIQQHPAPRSLDQQRTHRQLNAMAIVGRSQRLPQRARHDAEHRPAVR